MPINVVLFTQLLKFAIFPKFAVLIKGICAVSKWQRHFNTLPLGQLTEMVLVGFYLTFHLSAVDQSVYAYMYSCLSSSSCSTMAIV